MTRNATSKRRLILVLGYLTLIAPVGIDIYLPAFPAIGEAFGADAAMVQFSLVAYVAALAAGQAIWGPLSDRYGRKAPLVLGLLLAMVAALATTQATSIEALIALRVVQGLGACAAVVIARSIARDTGAGIDVARILATMAIIQVVSPALAPLLGSFVLAYGDWTAVLLAMAALSAGGVIVSATGLGETLPQARRANCIADAFARYRELGLDRRFGLTVLTGGCASGVFFAYLAGSPDALMTVGGFSPQEFGFYFGVNAVVMVAAARTSAALLAVVEPVALMRAVTLAPALLTSFLLALSLLDAATLPVTLMLLTAALAGEAMLHPIVAMRALADFPHAAGAASAVLGVVQYTSGAVVAGAVSLFADGSVLPMVTGIALSALCAAALTWSAR